MPVFISHRTSDDVIAARIAHRLGRIHGIACYLDNFDPRLKTTKQITDILVSAIERCTHLLAVVTDATRGSWWVPFEIGVARQADRRIATHDSSTGDLPQYLGEWPIVRGEAGVDVFAQTYHRDRAGKTWEKRATAGRAILTADQFHRELKAALGQ